VVEGVIGRLSHRELVRSSDKVFRLVLTLIFGVGLFAVEALVTFLAARWVFEKLF
jgi:hypothetical protein